MGSKICFVSTSVYGLEIYNSFLTALLYKEAYFNCDKYVHRRYLAIDLFIEHDRHFTRQPNCLCMRIYVTATAVSLNT
jgi:hypothetical protein